MSNPNVPGHKEAEKHSSIPIIPLIIARTLLQTNRTSLIELCKELIFVA